MSQRVEDLQKIAQELDKHHISYALGASGLLFALGLMEHREMGDWDLFTEAPHGDVKKALKNFASKDTVCGDYPYATEYKILFNEKGTAIEVAGNFAIYHQDQLCKIPVVISRIWEGIKLGSPEVWYVAYTLMERRASAHLLQSYLQSVGADQKILALLMKEPLSEFLKDALNKFPEKSAESLEAN
ncbi:hypothetical protein [Planomicrobium sp. CPCC 101079]|uniref:hypothetical protein n=1 Tax=Planomicrobium sp. CPCC 101079 TaxID=2599618 RepID=UPI0011B51280|nr:hypothetical protein [Planomicrobium sp. CPCC 101079]TWT09334.1 hypothetical protein FQV28_06790 [Planomicrobium sp. CPCC 101079]